MGLGKKTLGITEEATLEQRGPGSNPQPNIRTLFATGRKGCGIKIKLANSPEQRGSWRGCEIIFTSQLNALRGRCQDMFVNIQKSGSG